MLEKTIIDIHSHILPGVDDGASDYNEADAIIEAQCHDGVYCIYLTPHLRKGMFDVENHQIRHAFMKYQAHVAEKYPDVTLFLGREYFADSFFLDLIENQDVITLGESNCVLVEFSRGHNFRYIRNFCYQLMQKNMKPVIAHTERYPVLVEHREYVKELVELGAYIQINANSVLGEEGLKIKWFCSYLMKKNLIAFISSDCHNVTTRKPNLARCMHYIEKKLGKSYRVHIAWNQPYKILMRD
ncbi:MAG: CpsB/CapC family capsule biosynthesis tyrosine phosphatase [Lachnospiraceae bacterium]